MNYFIQKQKFSGTSRGIIFLSFVIGLWIMSMKEKEPEVKPEMAMPKIDLSNWKLTLPVGNPLEVSPPELLDYATDVVIKPYMYNDATDGSLVFFTQPGVTTENTKYSRTELREQLEPRNSSVNWTFEDGGKMKGKLQIADISKDENGKYHRTIIMQIHGKLSNDQKKLIGADDNDAPPILKIYWQNGQLKVSTKVLKDATLDGISILRKDAWKDDAGRYFTQKVGFDPFTLEVVASDGKLEVILNEGESLVYDSVDIQKWSVFENYFKAGNYFQTLDNDAYAKVKFFNLSVEH